MADAPPAGIAKRSDRLRKMAGARPVRFVLAGAFNTVFGLALYPILLWSAPVLRMHYLFALGIAQVVSTLFAYCSYKLMVFRTRAGVAREMGLFGSFYLAAAGVNWLALPVLVELMHLPPIMAQLGFSLTLMVASYLWHSRVTFRSARAPDAR